MEGKCCWVRRDNRRIEEGCRAGKVTNFFGKKSAKIVLTTFCNGYLDLIGKTRGIFLKTLIFARDFRKVVTQRSLHNGNFEEKNNLN